MGIRQRLADILAPQQKAVQPIVGAFSLQQANIPVYSDMTVRKATREGYKISVYVYRSIRTIIQAFSGIPWIVLDDDGEPIPEHDFEYVLKHPNKVMSGQDLMELLGGHLLLTGNALWQPMMVNGKIKELWAVMPDCVKPVPSSVKGEWLKEWQVTTTQGEYYTVPPETFIHFMQFDPGNPYWGTSPLMAAARTVDTDNEAQDTQKITMQNRATPDGVFTHEAMMTPEQFAEANRQIKESRTNKTNRRAPWVLGAGAKWQQMSLTPVEMDFIASRLANKQDIAAAFGLDPWWLGDKSTSTYNNVQEARKALYETTVIPMLDDIKATMNLRIAPMYGNVEITYDLSGVAALREDYAKKAETATRLWAMGVPMSQLNDVLELNLEEYEGWETSYLPFNVTPVTAIETEPPEPAPPPVIVQGGTQQPEDEETDAEDEQRAENEKEIPPQLKPFVKKTIQWSDEQKATLWKRIDIRRQAYWPIAAKRFRALYGAEGNAVVQAVQNAQGSDLKNQAMAAIRALRPQWEKTIKAVDSVVLEDFGKQTAQDLGAMKSVKAPWRFDPFAPAARHWLAEHVSKSTTVILDTDMERVSKVIEDGFAENLTTVEIGKALREFYDTNIPFNSMRTARTEVGTAAGYGSREAASQSGVANTKTWVSSRDDRVRDSHVDVDGETTDFNDVYSNGLLFPGDSSGDPSEFIQCRCAEVYG